MAPKRTTTTTSTTTTTTTTTPTTTTRPHTRLVRCAKELVHNLNICRLSRRTCSARGGDEVVLLCDKIKKGNFAEIKQQQNFVELEY